MNSRRDLRLDWCSYAAAKYACENWHYSGSIPAGKLVKIGAWESSVFIGAIIFSRGSTLQIGSPYNLDQTKVCELTRIALRGHVAPVSRMLSIAVKMLFRQSPGVRLIISYAAQEEGHHGGIYQAAGWIYEGPRPTYVVRLNGQVVHVRSIGSRWGTGAQSMEWLRKNVDPSAERIDGLVRHKYLMPLDDEMREHVKSLAQPYPKRPKQAMAGPQSAQRQGSTDPDAPEGFAA